MIRTFFASRSPTFWTVRDRVKPWPPAMVLVLTWLLERTRTGFRTTEGPLQPPLQPPPPPLSSAGLSPSVMATCRVKSCSAGSPCLSV